MYFTHMTFTLSNSEDILVHPVARLGHFYGFLWESYVRFTLYHPLRLPLENNCRINRGIPVHTFLKKKYDIFSRLKSSPFS
jgi:hypothetical protein